MTELVVAVLIGALLVQYPIGALVYLDARRLGLRDPEQYAIGIIFPAAGFVVILYYLSERRNFPKRTDDRT